MQRIFLQTDHQQVGRNTQVTAALSDCRSIRKTPGLLSILPLLPPGVLHMETEEDDFLARMSCPDNRAESGDIPSAALVLTAVRGGHFFTPLHQQQDGK